ncbi:MAG: UDP-N-acetylmuramoylalanine--D-glutamate ligase [Candidatus Saccharibacteria bacterium]|nr:UDP-N-acetylmuramoylalanine--D-glutamate ligase [Candidatus Saccharibacteria bacterium]
MTIAILGFGSQGESAYHYWNTPENDITICDSREDLQVPEGAKTKLGPDYLKGLAAFDLIVRGAPSIHPREITEANPEAPDILDKVTTATNEFFRVCPSQNIVGVTGTKGKGTTSTLITRMLDAAEHRVHLGGNIGIPPLDMLSNNIQPEDWVILELANFQLIDLHYSPHIAVVLMVEPEHQDWHEDLEEYIAAKQQMFINQEENDIAIYNANNENSVSIADASMGKQIPFMEAPGAYVKDNKIVIDDQVICDVDEIKLLGKHNWQNACAAVTAVWQITQNVEAIRETLKTFGGLPFRIELRTEKNGIKYYNDSFATAPGAAIAALESIPEPKVMIVGGHDRGLDLTELAHAFLRHKNDVRKVVLIGASAERVADTFKKNGFDNFVMNDSKDMNEIVRAATDLAEPGDAVVLSPSFASFDMFKNFEDRGNKFNEAIESL